MRLAPSHIGIHIGIRIGIRLSASLEPPTFKKNAKENRASHPPEGSNGASTLTAEQPPVAQWKIGTEQIGFTGTCA